MCVNSVSVSFIWYKVRGLYVYGVVCVGVSMGDRLNGVYVCVRCCAMFVSK